VERVGDQLVRASATGALRSEHTARALRRLNDVLVTADEESLTAVLRDRRSWNRALPRRDTRVQGIPAHNPKTGIRARTEHDHLNTSGSLCGSRIRFFSEKLR
jgi:hypothetical protein